MGILHPISPQRVMQVMHGQMSDLGTVAATTALALPTDPAQRTMAVELLSAADALLQGAAHDARAIHPSDGIIPLPSTPRRSDRLAESAMLRTSAAQDLIDRSKVFPEGYVTSYRQHGYAPSGFQYHSLVEPGRHELHLDTTTAIDMIGRRHLPELLVNGMTSRDLTRAAAGELEQTRSTVQNARRRIINEDLVSAADRQAISAVEELRADGLWNLKGTQQVDDATRLLMHEQLDAALSPKALAATRPTPVTAGRLDGTATLAQFRTKVAHESMLSTLKDAGKLEGGEFSMRSVDSRLAAGERALLHAQMARHQLTSIDVDNKGIQVVDTLIARIEGKMHAVRTGDATRVGRWDDPIFSSGKKESQLSQAITAAKSLSINLAEQNRKAAHAAIAERAGRLSSETLSTMRIDHGTTAREQAMKQVKKTLADGMLT